MPTCAREYASSSLLVASNAIIRAEATLSNALRQTQPDELVVRTPAEAAREPIREVEHRRHFGNVHDLLVTPAGLAQGLDVMLGAPVRSRPRASASHGRSWSRKAGSIMCWIGASR